MSQCHLKIKINRKKHLPQQNQKKKKNKTNIVNNDYEISHHFKL